MGARISPALDAARGVAPPRKRDIERLPSSSRLASDADWLDDLCTPLLQRSSTND
jgi:hypothetical protein